MASGDFFGLYKNCQQYLNTLSSITAQASQAQYKAALARLFERYDFLVSPRDGTGLSDVAAGY